MAQPSPRSVRKAFPFCLSHPAFGPKPGILLLLRANLRALPESCRVSAGKCQDWVHGISQHKVSIKAPLGSFAQFVHKSRGSPIIQMLMPLILSQRPLRLSSVVFIPFSLFCSSAVISTILSSSSLIYSSTSCVLSHFSRVQLCDPVDGSPPGSSVHGILQTRILEGLPCPSFSRSSASVILQLSRKKNKRIKIIFTLTLWKIKRVLVRKKKKAEGGFDPLPPCLFWF